MSLKGCGGFSNRGRFNGNEGGFLSVGVQRQLGVANDGSAKSIEKLSSGYRINRAGDDAAGLAISEKMRGQIRGLNQASNNAQDGISLLQTAEGALNETHAILQRMRELAVQSSTDTNTDTDRAEIQKEVDQLASEITRISTDTEFNTMKLLDGSYSDKKFHIGANKGQNTTINVNNMNADSLKVAGKEAAVYTQDATVASGKIGEYTAVSINDYSGPALASADVEGGDVSLVTHVLVDGEGAAYATSTDGKVFDEYGSGTGKVTLQETVAKNGKINITGATAGTAEVGVVNKGASVNKLAQGDYKVTDLSTNPMYEATYAFGLTDSDGNVVALAHDASGAVAKGDAMSTATNFVSVNDTTDVVLTLAGTHGLAGGSEIKVTGEGIDVSSQTSADAAITTINDALETVSSERSKLGAMQNRLEHTIKNLDTSSENLQASESRIRDVDMAKEMMEQTKQNILSQASTAMLAQANQHPQGVLQLLR